jgi:tetratricopeptide (TPR) repeat protein
MGSFRACAALFGIIVLFAIGATPAHAAKMYFGAQEHLRKIEDIDGRGPKDEALYLGHKYSFHSFVLPYRVTDDGYVLGVRDQQSYFRLDDATVKSLQDRGLLPSPLPPYYLTLLDYAMGHALWIALATVIVISLIPLSRRSKKCRKRAQPHLDDGIALHRAGDLNRAIESYTKAVEIDPKFAAAFHLRGRAFAGLRYFNPSIADQTKAIRLEPKYADALMDRGMLMYASGNFDGAVSDFSRVIKLNKKNVNAYFQRGLSYAGKSDFRRAIADFTRVIDSTPDFADAYHRRAAAYARLGNTRRARADQATAADIAKARPAA